jgi:uncharacterized protein
MKEKFSSFLIRRRLPILIAILAVTAFFFLSITGLSYQSGDKRVVLLEGLTIDSPTIDLFPSNHPYVETFLKYKDIFGGAGTILIAMEVKEGDIYNTETLSKIRRITKGLEEKTEAINNYQVLSLAQRKVKTLDVDHERGFRSIPVMWPSVPKTEEEIALLRHTIKASPQLDGTLVSKDSKAALILAGFFEQKLDKDTIKNNYRIIEEEILEPERDENTNFHLIGRPALLGYIMERYPQISWLFLATLLAIISVLMLYFRDVRGILVPLTTALLSAIWGLGFLSLLGHNFDPLVIVVPFIISARALSHSVQLVERYFEEYMERGSRKEAAEATFNGLAAPGMVGIITDAAGIALVFLTPIPLMQKLALMSSFWVLSILISDMIFNPIFLTYLPAPKNLRDPETTLTYKVLKRVGSWCFGKQRKVVIVSTIIVIVIGFFFAKNLQIGDVHPGTPMLWPDSKYNMDTDRISEMFGNTEIFSVIVEGESRDAIKNPQVLRTMEAFQKHMEKLPEVSSTSSIADLLPRIISILHGSDPKWEIIPDNPRETGFFLEMIYQSSQPGDLVRYVTIDSQNANITLYLKDHKGETLRTVVAHAKEFIENNPLEKAKFRLASGYGGLLAAINEVVAWQDTKITLLAFLIVFSFCALAHRSLLAGLLFLVPLIGSNYLTYALMGARKIGLDVNALPVVALGVGMGVDYGLYVVDRIKEEYQKSKNLEHAVVMGITTAGKAVAFTATTMVAGVVFWIFSFLRFQADMGLLLVFWMIISMIGGLLILPTLIAMIRPKFIVGNDD